MIWELLAICRWLKRWHWLWARVIKLSERLEICIVSSFISKLYGRNCRLGRLYMKTWMHTRNEMLHHVVLRILCKMSHLMCSEYESTPFEIGGDESIIQVISGK